MLYFNEFEPWSVKIEALFSLYMMTMRVFIEKINFYRLAKIKYHLFADIYISYNLTKDQFSEIYPKCDLFSWINLSIIQNYRELICIDGKESLNIKLELRLKVDLGSIYLKKVTNRFLLKRLFSDSCSEGFYRNLVYTDCFDGYMFIPIQTIKINDYIDFNYLLGQFENATINDRETIILFGILNNIVTNN